MKKADILRALALLSLIAAAVGGLIVLSVNAPLQEALGEALGQFRGSVWGPVVFAAVYAVRSKPGAPVSAPCRWEELEQGTVEPQTFKLRTMADRVAAVGDLWSDMYEHGHSLRGLVDKLQRS